MATSFQILDEKVCISVPEAGHILGMCRNSVYIAVARGDVPSVRVGGKILVPTAPLKRLLGIEAERQAA